jgi:hypothetical protein
MAKQQDSAEATINALDMNQVREHYLNRERTHEELRCLFDAEEVQAFARLALGINNPAGNYSAAEHGLGPRILLENSEQDIFDLAIAIEECPNIQHLPQVIHQQDLQYLGISIGSEIAMMLNPDRYWVGNVRTIWAHLLLRHDSCKTANDGLQLYRDKDRTSEMDYQIWRDLYLRLEDDILRLGRAAVAAAEVNGVQPGERRFMWPDAVASHLYDRFAVKT